MVALAEGTKAPELDLSAPDGRSFSLKQVAAEKNAVVLAFFKVSCPVCQLALPYLERLHRSYPEIPIWGVSQDDADATAAFARMYGITFTTLLDARLEKTVAYGLTNVPSIFLVTQAMEIELTSVGFARADLETLNSRLAELCERPATALFSDADEVPDFKPG